MRGKQRAQQHGREERSAAVGTSRARPSGTSVLPTWESFAMADRHRLVAALLRAARRQVEAGPVSGRVKG
jgi:hypothetical protein